MTELQHPYATVYYAAAVLRWQSDARRKKITARPHGASPPRI
jgi:hypothetical protein